MSEPREGEEESGTGLRFTEEADGPPHAIITAVAVSVAAASQRLVFIA